MGSWSKTRIGFSADMDTGSLQTKFLRMFLLAGFIFGMWIFINDIWRVITEPSIQSAFFLGTTLSGILLLGWLYFLNQRRRTQLAGYLYVGLWILGISALENLPNPDQNLILYVIPVAGASFVLQSSCSLAAAVFSLAVYSLKYFMAGSQTPYNFYFPVATFLVAAAAWYVSEHLNKALQTARRSEKMYQDLLENVPSVNYVITGTPKSRIIFISPRIQNLLGFTPREWGEQPERWALQLHRDDRDWVIAKWEQARDAVLPFQAEYRMIAKNGAVVWISDETIPIREADGNIRIQGIMMDITQRRQAESIQAVLYQISQSANAAQDLDGLFLQIHRALGSLIHAENFFIAFYHAADDTVSFPYYVDQFDTPPLPQKAGRGLTEYVLRSGKPILTSPETFEKMVNSGEVESIGAISVDWLGAPLKIGDRTIGVMALQSYTEKIRFTQEDLDLLSFVATQAARLIERKRAEEELRLSEKIYRTTIDSLDEMIHVENSEHVILMANSSFVRRNEKVGLEVDLLGLTIEQAFPYLEADTLELYRRVFESGEKIAVISERVLGGKKFIYNAQILPVFEAERAVRAITVLRDVTSEKQAEEQIKAALQEKEVLLREIHHRVKNNLQIMSSLLSLQADYVHDPHSLDMFRETQARLRSMALIHEELYQSQDLAQINYCEYIEKLTSNLFHAFNLNPLITLNLEIAEVYFNIDLAIPCGLIINELVTNALKYAFPENRAGVLTIRLAKTGPAGGASEYTLEISDDGIGIPGELLIGEPETLGLQLVKILVEQLKGSLVLDNRAGTHFTICFAEK